MFNICRFVRRFPLLNAVGFDGAFYLSKEQAELGAKVFVFSAKDGKAPDYEASNGIVVFRTRTPYNIFALKKLREIDKNFGIDIVHAHATACITYAFLRNLLGRKPYVIHVHGTTLGVLELCEPIRVSVGFMEALRGYCRTRVSLTRQKIMWKKGDMLIAVSESIANELHNKYDIPKEKIRVVHNGVDTTLFKPAVNKEEARRLLDIDWEPVILFVGHYGFGKGPQYLIKAASNVIKRFPHATFVMVGGIPQRLRTTAYWGILQDLIRKLKLKENIMLVGRIPFYDMLKYYWAADIFVLPSLYEGLPKVILEAMACGLPVVTTNVGGIPELVTNGENGLLVNPRNVDQLSDALIQLLQNPSMANSMGAKCRKRVERHFTWEVAARKVVTIYEEVAKR